MYKYSENFFDFKNFANAAGFAAIGFLILLAFFGNVNAHDPGLSAGEMRIEDGSAKITLSYSRSDIEGILKIDNDGDGRVSNDEFDLVLPKLQLIASNDAEVMLDGLRAEASKVDAIIDQSDAVHFEIIYDRIAAGQVRFRNGMLNRLARGHKQYFSFVDKNGQRSNEKLLDAKNDSVLIGLGSLHAERPQTFAQFILLGIEHILTGFDHLAFLLALLLVGGTFREAAKIITSFTLAHSISLALATFDIVHLSPAIVEPLIAASIIYVGLENIFRRETDRRWMLTFAFGLVHGLGFASVLRDLGIGRNVGQTLVPLLSFNLGVEFGQIAIATLIVPLIWKLRERQEFRPRYVPAFSILLAVLGGFWFIERTFI